VDGVPAANVRTMSPLSSRSSHLRRRLGFRSIRFQIGELQLELVEQRTTLRGLAEAIVPELPNRKLELLDQ
jgi:hypothetical protein